MKRKFITSLIVIFAVLAVLESLFANRQSLSVMLHKLDTVTLDLSDASVSGSVSAYSGGSLSVRGKGSLTIDNIGTEVRYITFNTKKYSHIFTFSMEKTDDASSVKRNKVGDYRFMPGGDDSFGITSDGKLHSLTINFDSGSLFTVNSITLNKKLPFCFNLARFIIVFAVCAFISGILCFKLWERVYDPEKPVWNYTTLAAVICAMVFTVLSTVKASGFDKYPYERPIAEYDAYGQLFDAFQKGRLDLDIPFDAEAYENLENPYDYYERRDKLGGTGNLWDRAYHDGKLYCYFGVAPVLLIYYPIYIVSGYVPRPGTVAMLLTLAATVAILFALRSAMRHYKLKPPAILAAFGSIALCGSSLIYVMNAHPSMYYNAVLSGILFMVLTIAFSYRAIDATVPKRRYIFLVAAALSAVFTVASRPTLLLFAVMVAPFYIDLVLSKKREVAEKLKNAASFGIPLVIGALAVMWYNNARFGSPFDFGNNYQLTFSDVSYNTLELSRFFPALYHYFLQMPAPTGMFPFIDLNTVNLEAYRGYTYTYGSVGAFAFPANLGVFGIGATSPDKTKKFTYLSAIGAAIVIAFLNMCMAGVHIRYEADIAFPVAFVAVLVLFELVCMAQNRSERAKKHIFFAVSALFVLSIVVSSALLFANEADNMYYNLPNLFMFFDGLFR